MMISILLFKMGYITLFKIKYSHNKKEIKKYIKQLLEEERIKEDEHMMKHNQDILSSTYEPDFYYNTSEWVKWYNYERDILKISNQFPDVLIKVYGKGEEDDDRWVQYFKNGKCSDVLYATITIKYKKFKESLLS